MSELIDAFLSKLSEEEKISLEKWKTEQWNKAIEVLREKSEKEPVDRFDRRAIAGYKRQLESPHPNPYGFCCAAQSYVITPTTIGDELHIQDNATGEKFYLDSDL